MKQITPEDIMNPELKTAVMQPYTFPYIGYFQLINAVDIFVFYDDVNFIKGGWINRNRILSGSTDYRMTIPLKNISPNRKICETELAGKQFQFWYDKFRKTLAHSYSKAPCYSDAMHLIESTFSQDFRFISNLAMASVMKTCEYLDLETRFQKSSESYSGNRDLNRTERLIDICRRNHSGTYINPIGGQSLYTKDAFRQHGIDLHFLSSDDIQYPQFSSDFIPNLSIIDVLMFNTKDEIKNFLKEYRLI